MTDRWLYGGVALLAIVAGLTFRALEGTPAKPQLSEVTIGPAALYATSVVDESGQPFSLGRYQGRVLLINFWATWCAPCREEMPALSAAAERWGDRVAILGLSSEPAATVDAFRQASRLRYALATGGAAIDELATRLGNTAGVLPYSAVISGDGRVLDRRVGPYSPAELDAVLAAAVAKSAQLHRSP